VLRPHLQGSADLSLDADAGADAAGHLPLAAADQVGAVDDAGADARPDSVDDRFAARRGAAPLLVRGGGRRGAGVLAAASRLGGGSVCRMRTRVPPRAVSNSTTSRESRASGGNSTVRQVCTIRLPASTPRKIPWMYPSQEVNRPPAHGSTMASPPPVKAACSFASIQAAKTRCASAGTTISNWNPSGIRPPFLQSNEG